MSLRLHCRVLSSTGGVLVSCQVISTAVRYNFCSHLPLKDMSTNGVIINGHKLRKAAAIIMDGDEIEFPYSQREPSFVEYLRPTTYSPY